MGTIETSPKPTFQEALAVWAKIGVLSFGGPAGQIALMHRVLVDERRWISEERFLHALNFCMLLPGPEAMQFATYVGWRLHGTTGGLVAGMLFVLPGAFVVLALSIAYAFYGQVPLVEIAFLGIKAAVLMIVVEALLRVARRALRGPYDVAIAAAAFIAIFFFAAPFPLIIAGAAMIGFLLPHRRPAAPSQLADSPVSLSRTLRTAAVWLAIWIVPLVLLAVLLGRTHVTTDIALFFSKLAIVTFGGAYSVLAYMAQQPVETYGWLSAGEMLDGLGLAETAPRRAEARAWTARRSGHALGDLCAVLPVDLYRRALCRAPRLKPSPCWGACRRHGCGRRRHFQFESLVRAPRPVRRGHRDMAWSAAPVDA